MFMSDDPSQVIVNDHGHRHTPDGDGRIDDLLLLLNAGEVQVL